MFVFLSVLQEGQNSLEADGISPNQCRDDYSEAEEKLLPEP